ncbi:MAG: hypothetical protein ACRD12_22985 [Acidimicrobiales bacterium]
MADVVGPQTVHAIGIGASVFVALGLQQVVATGVVAYFCHHYRGHACPSHDATPSGPAAASRPGGDGTGAGQSPASAALVINDAAVVDEAEKPSEAWNHTSARAEAAHDGAVGQLGGGTHGPSRAGPRPREPVLAVQRRPGIPAGAYHSLAVPMDGSLRAWGWNGSGAFGTDGSADSRVPVVVPGPVAAVAAAGGVHSLMA